MIFYHGGVAGLPIGGFILPAAEIGAVDPDYLEIASRAYVTTDLWIAWERARYVDGGGCVYVVQPIGRIELDDTFDDGASDTVFACDRALILSRLGVWGKHG
jgi:hypothetical protein